jgi:hypothetical protein
MQDEGVRACPTLMAVPWQILAVLAGSEARAAKACWAAWALRYQLPAIGQAAACFPVPRKRRSLAVSLGAFWARPQEQDLPFTPSGIPSASLPLGCGSPRVDTALISRIAHKVIVDNNCILKRCQRIGRTQCAVVAKLTRALWASGECRVGRLLGFGTTNHNAPP